MIYNNYAKCLTKPERGWIPLFYRLFEFKIMTYVNNVQDTGTQNFMLLFV